jgi:Fe-S oxidoreductase
MNILNLEGNEVVHHTEFLKSLLDDGRLTMKGGQFKGKKITFHDPCYLGRANKIYEAPRELIEKLDVELVEMKRSKSKWFMLWSRRIKCLKMQNQEIKR